MSSNPAAALLVQSWFPGHASAVPQARRFVADVLGEGFPARDEVLLLVSEVAANAVRHSASGDGGEFEVAVWVTGGMVRVEIGDQGGASEPRLADDGVSADALTGGRGLRIVDALATKWGHAGDELGRVVWFEVESP
ncbi:MAG TPA: ATP-binding protein [Streptosporangiaceae bacterium]|nr:ATP-binding protein [Streptosporangiaceae bacterium]